MAAGKAPEPKVAAAGAALKQEAHFGADLLRRHGWRLLLVFAGLLLPLWGFAELADEIHEQQALPFDEPILQFVHTLASAGHDRVFVWISAAGYLHGVVPFDVALVLVLTLLRRFREATFATFALAGAALLNVAAKHSFARIRPALWNSISPETTFSFPSGHAMGSAALACVLIVLAWGTRWRWPVVVLSGHPGRLGGGGGVGGGCLPDRVPRRPAALATGREHPLSYSPGLAAAVGAEVAARLANRASRWAM